MEESPIFLTLASLSTKKIPSFDQWSVPVMTDTEHGKEQHLQLGAFCSVYSILGPVYEDKEQDQEWCYKLWEKSV